MVQLTHCLQMGLQRVHDAIGQHRYPALVTLGVANHQLMLSKIDVLNAQLQPLTQP
jgi:hypothetical protein